MTGRPPGGCGKSSRLTRRSLIAATAGLGAASLAGCGFLESKTVRSPPLVEDRPRGIYYPSHIEGMAMGDTGSDGRYRFALTYSFPHRFWTVDGNRTTTVELTGDSSVHLMVTAWDEETGRVLPASNQHVTVSKDGTTHVDRSLWRMLSQNMGVHFGDNVALDGDGTYDVKLAFGPLEETLTGDLAGAFRDPARASMRLEFSQSTLEEVTFERLDDRKGKRGAVEPMDSGMLPVARAPASDALPGEPLGSTESGDVLLEIVALPTSPAPQEPGGPYLAVSPRTRYNSFPLPGMSLSATVPGDSGTVFEDFLTPASGSDLGYHYGAVIEGLHDATAVQLSPGLTPQIARHEGYETAFMELPDASVSL